MSRPQHCEAGAEPTSATARLDTSLLASGVAIPLVVGLLIGAVFVAVYLAAFHDPQPHRIPVAVVGEESVVTGLRAAVEQQGGDAVDLRPYSSAQAATAAVRNRTVLGALVIGAAAPDIVVAGANGSSVTETLQSAFGRAFPTPDRTPTTSDVAPLSPGDSRGFAVFYAAFGIVLGGFLFGQTSMQGGAALPFRWRAVSTLAFSLIAGLGVALLVRYAFDALPAPYFLTAAIIGLLALAVASSTAAMLELLGPAGTPIASLVLLVFGNATSTGILPAEYLPSWLEPLTAVLPVGVAVRALRGAAYFGNDGVVVGISVLVAWVVASVLVSRTNIDKLRRGPGDTPPLMTV